MSGLIINPFQVQPLITGGPWDFSGAIYNSISKVIPNMTQARGLYTVPGGLIAFAVDRIATGDIVRKYSMSPANDITSLTQVDTFALSGQSLANDAMDIFFSPDGLKMFIMGFSPQDQIHQYTLTGAHDISAPTFDGQYGDTFGGNPATFGLFIKPDGLKAWVTEGTGQIFPVTLTTAWDFIATAPSTGTATSPGGLPSVNWRDIYFRDDGTRFYLASFTATENAVFQFDLSVPWDETSHDAGTVISLPDSGNNSGTPPFSITDVEITQSGTKATILNPLDNTLYEYDL